MASSIFGRRYAAPAMDTAAIRSIMSNPRAAFEYMMSSNPRFAEFVRTNRGKTPEQAFRDYGLDFNQFRGMIR